MKKVFVLLLILTGISFAQINPEMYNLSADNIGKASGDTPLSNSITDIMIIGDTIWIGSSRGLSRSTDNGTSWTDYWNTPSFGGEAIIALGYHNKTVWVSTGHNEDGVGGESVIPGSGYRFSNDNGTTWTSLPQSVEDPGDSSITYGVNTLRALPITVAQQNVTYDIAFTSNTIWTASWAGGLRKNNIDSLMLNPNRPWERVVLPPDYLSAIHPDSVYNFSLQPKAGAFGDEEYLNHVAFSIVSANESTIYVGTANGINKSTDNGITWTKFNHQNQRKPISGNFITALGYDEIKQVVWASSWKADAPEEFYGVSASSDGGESWETFLNDERPHNFGFKYYLTDGGINTSDVFVPTDNGVYRSNNDGASWLLPSSIKDTKSAVLTSVFYDVETKSLNDGTHEIWIGSADGLAVLQETGGIWQGDWKVFTASPELKSKNETYAFPNPFNPSFKPVRIKYSVIGQAQDVTIRILDFGMNLIRTVVQNASRNPSENIFEIWDGRDESGSIVPNGVYFYRVDIGSNDPMYGKIMVIR
ncbi:MAG: hypothetical protein K9H06_14065 [Melioribacteraceae bacterium]|nr:hypothetical protein [Melioribacteraceae bacterium]